MDISKLRNLTNCYQDLHLVSLSKLKLATEFPERDNSGPYLVAQAGYDPEDPTVSPTEFLLSKSGVWLATEWFFCLPVEQRRTEYFFARSEEVMQLLQNLPVAAVIARPGTKLPESPDDEDANEIKHAIQTRRKE